LGPIPNPQSPIYPNLFYFSFFFNKCCIFLKLTERYIIILVIAGNGLNNNS
jgi:hypothetical protein